MATTATTRSSAQAPQRSQPVAGPHKQRQNPDHLQSAPGVYKVATQTRQRIAGVIENMSYLICSHCGEQQDIFGSGGGESVAVALSQLSGTSVPLLGQVPIDTRLREGGDNGTPLVLADPSSPAALQLTKIAESVASRGRGLAGRMLGLSPR